MIIRSYFPREASTLLAILCLVGLAPGRALATGLPLHVVTSIPPLAMIVSEFGGDRVVVHSILPPGADPHTFEPRPSDAVAIAEADIVVMLGSSIDDWIGDAIEARKGGVTVRLDEDAAGSTEEESGRDPHVWLDPTWVRERATPALQRALETVDPAGAPHYGVAARAMAENLADLELQIRKTLDRASTRSFFAWHPAWEQFAHRFGLHSVGSVGESEGREPSLHAMIAAVRAAHAAGVHGVLVEPQVDSRQASVIADELGVPLVTVDPLGDAWSLDRATYGTLMMFNARAFARALSAQQDEAASAPVSAVPPTPALR